MPHGEIRKDEVGGLFRSVQISGTGNGNAGQNRDSRWSVHLATGNRAGYFEAGIQHERSVVQHGDVGIVAEDPEFDHWRRINGSTVGGCCTKDKSATCRAPAEHETYIEGPSRTLSLSLVVVRLRGGM